MKRQTILAIVVLALTGLSCLAAPQNTAPKYEVDPFWPMPLPDRWVVGQLGAVCVDQQDHVFVLNRQDVKDEELDAGRLAPPVFELDAAGKVVNSWGGAKELPRGLHGCTVDKDNNVWIVGEGSGIAHKYSHDGSKLLARVGRDDLRLSGIAVDRQNGDVYVTSGRTNPGITVFDRNGQLLRQWKLRRTETEKDIVSNLHCIGKSEDGLVYVCDRLADRLQKSSPEKLRPIMCTCSSAIEPIRTSAKSFSG